MYCQQKSGKTGILNNAQKNIEIYCSQYTCDHKKPIFLLSVIYGLKNGDILCMVHYLCLLKSYCKTEVDLGLPKAGVIFERICFAKIVSDSNSKIALFKVAF